MHLLNGTLQGSFILLNLSEISHYTAVMSDALYTNKIEIKIG
jgi:hypothetical protein